MYKLTNREWIVLEHFMREEGSKLSGMNWSSKKPVLRRGVGKDDHYYAYAKMIEDDLQKKVSRGWAAKICKHFEEMGIFGHEKGWTNRQKDQTEHYYLKTDTDSFIKLTKILLYRLDDSRNNYWTFGNEFNRMRINESLVRDILSRKNVMMPRSLYFTYWNEYDALRLYKLYTASIEKTDLSKSEYQRFDPGLTFKEFVNKVLTYQMDNDPNKGRKWSCPRIQLQFPVFSSDAKLEDSIARFRNANKFMLECYPIVDFNSSGVKRHYMEHEFDSLVLPILVLIKISPNALAYFLYGEWKYTNASYTDQGTSGMDRVLFRLLFLAINDLAVIRDILPQELVEEAYMGGDKRLNNDRTYRPLLRLRFRDKNQICFDGGFDTVHHWIGNAIGDVWETDTNGNYWAESWIDYDYKHNKGLLTRDSIKNSSAIITKLKKANDKQVAYLREKFSHESQHIIKYFDITPDNRDIIIERTLDECNRLITGESLYTDDIFGNVISSNTKMFVEDLQRQKNSMFSIKLNMDNTTKLLNKSLIEDVFCDGLNKTNWVVLDFSKK